MHTPRHHRAAGATAVIGVLALGCPAAALALPLSHHAGHAGGPGLDRTTAATLTTQVVRTESQLRRAVSRANRRAGQDRIRLAGDIRLMRDGDGGPRFGDLDVTDDLTILGGGHLIDGRRNDRILDVRPDTRLVLRDSILSKGRAEAGEAGGAIRNLGSTVVTGSTLEDNVAQGGGAVVNDGGELTIESSRVRRNSADGVAGSGGGLLNTDDGSVTVDDVEFRANSAVRAGGAIETEGGTVSITATNVRGGGAGSGPDRGSVPGRGGALHITGAGHVTWHIGLVRENLATAEGGGLWNSSTGTLITTRVTVEGNEAPVDPDVHNDGGLFTIDGEPVPATP